MRSHVRNRLDEFAACRIDRGRADGADAVTIRGRRHSSGSGSMRTIGCRHGPGPTTFQVSNLLMAASIAILICACSAASETTTTVPAGAAQSPEVGGDDWCSMPSMPGTSRLAAANTIEEQMVWLAMAEGASLQEAARPSRRWRRVGRGQLLDRLHAAGGRAPGCDHLYCRDPGWRPHIRDRVTWVAPTISVWSCGASRNGRSMLWRRSARRWPPGWRMRSRSSPPIPATKPTVFVTYWAIRRTASRSQRPTPASMNRPARLSPTSPNRLDRMSS